MKLSEMKANYLMTAVLTLMLTACTKKPVSPDTPYIIDGEVTGVKDGVELVLASFDGDVGNLIARDTIFGGKFHFESQMEDIEVNRLGLFAVDDDFSSLKRYIYVAPGAHVKVTGNGTHIMSWKVQSKVPEQKALDELYAIHEYDFTQDVLVAEKKALKEMRSIDRNAEPERYAEARNRYKVFYDQQDSMYFVVQEKRALLMKSLKPSQPWMTELNYLARMVRTMPELTYAEDVKEMYKTLSEEWKQTKLGKEIYANLYPPQEVKVGDDCPDADFYDLEGNLHHLAEHKGKYILLDFWNSGCAGCIQAFPKMKKLYEKYNDKLAIVSMSIDTDRRWRMASEKHNLTWSNWNEGKGEGGLYTNFRTNGIPFYVLVNPEGKVIKMELGYLEDNFSALFTELFD